MKFRSATDMHLTKSDKPVFEFGPSMANGVEIEIISTDSSTGGFSCILHGKKNATFEPHLHLAGCEYLILSGALNYRDEVAPAGDSGYESYGSLHEKTVFPEDTEMLFITHGPILFLDENNEPTEILDSRWIENRIGQEQGQLQTA